jgi:hypothetical protein
VTTIGHGVIDSSSGKFFYRIGEGCGNSVRVRKEGDRRNTAVATMDHHARVAEPMLSCRKSPRPKTAIFI